MDLGHVCLFLVFVLFYWFVALFLFSKDREKKRTWSWVSKKDLRGVWEGEIKPGYFVWKKISINNHNKFGFIYVFLYKGFYDTWNFESIFSLKFFEILIWLKYFFPPFLSQNHSIFPSPALLQIHDPFLFANYIKCIYIYVYSSILLNKTCSVCIMLPVWIFSGIKNVANRMLVLKEHEFITKHWSLGCRKRKGKQRK